MRKTAKKWLAFLLAASMVMSLLCVTALAVEEGAELDWNASEIVISDVETLKAFAEKVNGGTTFQGQTVTLGADLDLANEAWTPIGTSDNPFKGTFEGGNKTVSNLTVTGENSFVGLFGRTMAPAVVKDLTVNNAAVSGRQCVAALVGSAYTGAVTNCHVTGDIKITGSYDVGGLTGYGYAKYENCSVVGNDGSFVTGTYKEANLEGDNVGGLIGYFAEGSGAMTSCRAENLTVTGTRKVGGLIGSTHADRSLIDCSAKNVAVGTNATAEYANDNLKTMGIGGLIGLFNSASGGKLENCAVENITLTNENGVTAKLGYISGGGRASAEFNVPEMTFTNVAISGVNTGSNADIHSPIISGNMVLTENTVAEVDGQYFESIQSALDSAESGDVVEVLVGEHTESIAMPLQSVILRGADGAVLKGKVDFAAGAMPEGAEIVIENLTFENACIHLVSWTKTTNLNQMGGLTIRNNIFNGAPNETGTFYAVHINNGDDAVNNLTVTGNTFNGCGTKDGGAVYATTCGVLTVTDNTFHDSAMNALTLTGKDSKGNTTASAQIVGNTFDSWAAKPAGRTDGRAMRLSNLECPVDLRENSFVSENLPEEYIKLTGGTAATEVKLDNNYWGGGAPASDKLIVPEGMQPITYYTDAEMTNLVLVENADVAATVGGSYYRTLQAAIAAAEPGDTVTLLKDVETSEFIFVDKSLTIEGGNHKVASTASRILRVTGNGAEVTLNDIAFISAKAERGVQVDTDVTGVTLNINHCIIPGTYYAVNICSGADVTLNIDRSVISGWGALNLWGSNYEVKVTNSTLNGHNDKPYSAEGWNGFGTIVLEGDTTGKTEDHVEGCHVVLENCTITATTVVNEDGTANVQKVVLFNAKSANNVVEIKGNSTVVTYAQGELTPFCVDNGTGNTFTITGGAFSTDVTEYAAEGYTVRQAADGTYTVSRRTVYVPPVSGDTELEDPDVPLAEPLPFIDVKQGDWYYDAVEFVYRKELIKGVTGTTFQPAGTTTRGMLLTLLYRLEGEPAVEGATRFSDVADDAYYAKALAWGEQNGLVKGYGDGTVRPDMLISREQMATALKRYADFKGYDTTGRTTLAVFADAENVSGYAEESLQWMVSAGLIKGMSGSTLLPGGDATRGQFAALLMNFCQMFEAE